LSRSSCAQPLDREGRYLLGRLYDEFLTIFSPRRYNDVANEIRPRNERYHESHELISLHWFPHQRKNKIRPGGGARRLTAVALCPTGTRAEAVAGDTHLPAQRQASSQFSPIGHGRPSVASAVNNSHISSEGSGPILTAVGMPPAKPHDRGQAPATLGKMRRHVCSLGPVTRDCKKFRCGAFRFSCLMGGYKPAMSPVDCLAVSCLYLCKLSQQEAKPGISHLYKPSI
jgi:hypothetical protein